MAETMGMIEGNSGEEIDGMLKGFEGIDPKRVSSKMDTDFTIITNVEGRVSNNTKDSGATVTAGFETGGFGLMVEGDNNGLSGIYGKYEQQISGDSNVYVQGSYIERNARLNLPEIGERRNTDVNQLAFVLGANHTISEGISLQPVARYFKTFAKDLGHTTDKVLPNGDMSKWYAGVQKSQTLQFGMGTQVNLGNIGTVKVEPRYEKAKDNSMGLPGGVVSGRKESGLGLNLEYNSPDIFVQGDNLRIEGDIGPNSNYVDVSYNTEIYNNGSTNIKGSVGMRAEKYKDSRRGETDLSATVGLKATFGGPGEKVNPGLLLDPKLTKLQRVKIGEADPIEKRTNPPVHNTLQSAYSQEVPQQENKTKKPDEKDESKETAPVKQEKENKKTPDEVIDKPTAPIVTTSVKTVEKSETVNPDGTRTTTAKVVQQTIITTDGLTTTQNNTYLYTDKSASISPVTTKPDKKDTGSTSKTTEKGSSEKNKTINKI